MNHPPLIEAIFRACEFRSYLEIGIAHGETMRRVAPLCEIGRCVGVDPVPAPDGATWRHFVGTSDEFFGVNNEKFDCVFIDGDHAWQQVGHDFANAMRCLATPHGVILLHDTDPATHTMTARHLCGSAYKWRQVAPAGAVTLPVGNEGLTIWRPGGFRMWEG